MGKKKGKAKTAKLVVMPGLDFGIDKTTAVLTAPDFNDNMRDAEIIAAAYGEMRAPGFGAVTPCVSMVAKNPEPLKLAFKQFEAWIDATGPDALKVEILYNGEGYYISFGPEYRHALWRTVGLDELYNPLFFGVTYIKSIDSRNPFIDDLAAYSKRPVAPLVLRGARFTGERAEGAAPRPSEIQDIPDCPEFLIFNLPVFKEKKDVPKFSGLAVVASKPDKKELAENSRAFKEQAKGPESVSLARERRLNSLMPITLHMLRNYEPLQTYCAALEAEGFQRWQVEQAIINLRLWSLASPAQRARFQNANDLYKTLQSLMELDSPDWAVIANSDGAIRSQIFRDARALLKAVGVEAPKTIEACQAILVSRGYVSIKPTHAA